MIASKELIMTAIPGSKHRDKVIFLFIRTNLIDL